MLPAGMQAEAVAGQWSYTLGACAGIQAGDQLWVSRYLLHRLAENYGVTASLDPKPVIPAPLALLLVLFRPLLRRSTIFFLLSDLLLHVPSFPYFFAAVAAVNLPAMMSRS